MRTHWVRQVAAYFGSTAQTYRSAIEPAFALLTAEMVAFAGVRAEEWVLDLGTGTGLAARQACLHSRHVVGVDISRPMLLAAPRPRAWMAVQGDNHQLPFRDARFNVVTASFALNSSDPRLALAEVVRVLVPGGRVVLQEWGMLDGLSELVADTIAEYAVEDPPPPLAELRAQTQEPLPWDDIETADELGDLVRELGLSEIELRQEVSTVSFASVGAFLRFKLAWPIREAELNAMPKETLGLCLSELQENLAAHGEADGSLIWRPGVFRVRAFKPAR